jgi:antitoxin MazE
MLTKVQKWGNSLAVRLPKAFTDEIDVHHDSPVEVVVRGKAIILRPARPTYHLDDLLDRVKPENLHGEVGFGRPVGKEEW